MGFNVQEQTDVDLDAIMKPEQLEIFKKNTSILANQSERFVSTYYPSYMSTGSHIENMLQEDSLSALNNLTFYKLNECSVDGIDDLFAYFSSKLQKLFTTAYSIMQPICYGIISHGGDTSVVLGVAPANDEDKDVIKQIVEGLLPGMTLSKFSGQFKNSKSETKRDTVSYDKDRYLGCISGVPALKKDGQYLSKDISSLMRSLNGANYTILVMAAPVDGAAIQSKIDDAIEIKDKCIRISKQTLTLQQGTSQGTAHMEGRAINDGWNEVTGNNAGMNLSGGLPGLAAGAGIGFLAGGGVGAVVGGLGGLLVGKQVNFTAGKSKSKGTNHSESISYSDTVSESINQSGSMAFDVQNGYAIELMQMADSVIERLKIGRSIGMWNMAVTYSSDSKIVRDIIQGSMYSELATGDPNILPPVTFAAKDQCIVDGQIKKKHTAHLLIPDELLNRENVKAGRGSGIVSVVTSEELCGVCTLPTENVPGFEIKAVKSYPINCPTGEKGDILLGTVCEFDRQINNVKFSLSENDIVKHIFVCGITGSGKTTTVKKILCSTDKPFLVIEPAKKEYRNIAKADVSVYTLGRPEANCLRFNPFYIMPGINPQQHIDLLKDLFSASFSFYGPMPYIFEKCLHNIYIKKGWNLTLGYHPCLVDQKNPEELFGSDEINRRYALISHNFLFPTMQDLKNEVDYYIETNLEYEGEVKGNIKSAIKARIDSLCVGAKGYMFNTTQMTNFQTVLSQNAVFELEGLADDSDKAFALGLLIIFINEHRQIQKELQGSRKAGLQHILVIEEAHRLLKNVFIEQNEDLGNPKGKAVEHFTNMLAEMRSYGQGVIVAEQIPSKLAPDIIKNSSNKIVHRIVAVDDQQVIANTIGITTEDAIYLGINKTGHALCHKEGMALPVLVKVNPIEDFQSKSDHMLYKEALQNKLEGINTSSIRAACNNLIYCWAIKLINSLFLNQSCNIIAEGIERFITMVRSELDLYAISLVPGPKKDVCIKQCLKDAVIDSLVNGIYSQGTLPSNKLIQALNDFIMISNEQNGIVLRNELEFNFKPQTLKDRAIGNICNLLGEEYVAGNDVALLTGQFLIQADEDIAQAIKQKLERRMKHAVS